MIADTRLALDTAPDDDAQPSRLPGLLRALGAGALALGMYIFLMKGWQHGSDLLRYLIMLAHTVVLAGAGLFSGHWLKESKGARLLVMMSLASIPANFAIVGGFLYSVSEPTALLQYPRYVAWALDSLPLALSTAALALLVLAPVAKLGFSVLARPVSTPLTTLFIASNAALMLPVRDPLWISVIAITLALVQLRFNQRLLTHHIAGKTREGLIALSLLFLPIAVLVGRSLWLYHNSFLIAVTNVILVYLLLRRFSLSLPAEHPARQVLDLLAIFAALWLGSLATGWMYFADAPSLRSVLPLCLLGAAAMLHDISLRNEPGRSLLRAMAGMAYGLHFLTYLYLFDGLFAAQLCLFAGLAGIAIGYQQSQRSLFLAGSVVTLTGTLRTLAIIYASFNLGGWLTLAILGVALIVLASWLEARGNQLQAYLSALRSRYRSWEY